MKNLIENMRNKVQVKYLPFIVLFIISITYSLTAQLGYNDDKMFLDIFSSLDGSILDFVKLRYDTWSSRIFIEAILVYMTNNHLLWRIINILTLFGTGLGMSMLLPKTNNLINWIIVLFISGYTYIDMASAGWIATTLNYSWPLFFGIISMIPLKKVYFKENINKYMIPVYLAFTLLAANVEQMAGILFCVLGISIILSYKSRKRSVLVYVQFLIVILSLILIFMSPGNFERKIIEIGVWFPEYASLSLARLVEIGFSSTFYPLFFQPNFTFLIFSITVFILTLSKTKDSFVRFISFIPLIVISVFNIFNQNLNSLFPLINHVKLALTKTGTGASIASLVSIIPDFIILIVISSVIISLYSNIKERNRFVFLIGVLILGFISRFVMIFSPTIWASVERTFIFFYFSIMYVSLLILLEISENGETRIINSLMLKYIVWVLILITFINNIFMISFRFS